MSNIAPNRLKHEAELGSLGAYFALLKPRVMSLAIFTALCGQILALHNSPVHPVLFIISLLSIALGAGAAGCINMWYDRDIDPEMSRTDKRPVPLGIVSPNNALWFGISISILGVAWFLTMSNAVAAFWSGFSILFYVLIYTMWLKRRTPQNIVIGGIAGSTPPLIGWAVAAADYTNNMNPLDLGSPIPWMLFALIFLWTPPHFWALALYRSGEYAKAEVPMMNEVRGARYTIKQSKIYCILLLMLGSVPCFWPESGLPLLWAFVAGGLTLWYSMSVWAIDPDESFDANGRMPKAAKSFFRSLYYLGWMFLLLVIICAIPPDSLGYLGPLSQN